MMIEMILRFEFKTPYIIKSGFGYAGIYDDMLVRDGSGNFYIPGSTVKGRIRAYTLKMLSSLGESVCDGGNICKDRSKACMCCRLFGSPFMECTLTYTDGRLEKEQEKFFETINRRSKDFPIILDTVGTTNISINRKRKTALDKGLFVTELPPEGMRFNSRIYGEIRDEDLKFLQKGIQLITHFGANKGRGIGRLTDNGIVMEVTKCG